MGISTGDEIISSPAIGADGTIYVGSDDGNLYAITADGKQQWAFPTGLDLLLPGIGADGTIYVGSYDAIFTAIVDSVPSSPTISSFTPTSGDTGTVVSISGTSFTGATAVAFGGLDAAVLHRRQRFTITATVGPWLLRRHHRHHARRHGDQQRHLHLYRRCSNAATGGCSITISSIPDAVRSPARYACATVGVFHRWDQIWSSPAIGADGTIYVGSCG